MDPSTATRDPKRATLLAYISSLADLSHPKTALRILEDAPRLGAFQSALKKALEERPGAHVLALSSGGGVLPLMAAAAGAARVTAVERSRMLYRMTKQILASNEDSLGPNTVHLVARSLRAVRVAADAGSPVEELQQQAVAESEQHANVHPGGDFELLPRKADVLVTDLLDHTALGMGLLSSIDYAAQHLLVPGAVVLPSRVTVHAVLLELCLGDVNGFDLSPMDSYRWYPGDERVQLAELPHRALSKPFVAHTIDLQARVTAVQKAASTATEMANGATPPIEGAPTGQQASEKAQGGEGGSCWEADLELEVDIVADGRWNAVAFWFELDLGVASAQKLGTGTVAAAADTHDLATSQISNHTLASYVWPGAERGGTATATASAAPTVGKSWGQAVQYLDGTAVKAGTAVALRVRQDAGQIVFTSTPPPSRLRHALVPRWHYDMILDSARNDAYNAAIRRAVAAKRDAGCRQLAVLDMGAGSGLLSMMAARAGADKVFAAELSGHMCDVAEETTIMNGFLGKILVLDRDVRRMDTVPKPDGTAPELPRRVDMAVFEVFDSGLIGEGVLHILAAAQMRLLAPGASLVPASAVVYAQPMQMRVESAAGFDVQQANRWRWRPDYEGVELGKRRQDWKPLAEPMEVFSFDFYDIQRAVAVNEALLDFEITAPGVCNAVAMWFDLHLDEETTLSTCPYVDKGPTWQQAVQWLPEVRVAPGERLAITARHDTYSISYALEPGSNGGEEALTARGSGVPLVDPVWKATFDGMQGINSQLVKACVQNPLEFRVAAMAAIQFAARPHEVGLDAAQAAEFCVKMMG